MCCYLLFGSVRKYEQGTSKMIPCATLPNRSVAGWGDDAVREGRMWNHDPAYKPVMGREFNAAVSIVFPHLD